MKDFTAAVVQMNSGADVNANLERARELARRAALEGARLVALPENFATMAPFETRVQQAEPVEGSMVKAMADLARTEEIFLILGSIPERGPEPNKMYNTSVLIGPDGTVIATYRKIHLFDVDLPHEGAFRESHWVGRGERTRIAETSIARLGLSVCYDLRFPELYLQLAGDGAEVLSVPAAFTFETGRDHWEVLLRARAIENTAFVLAPAQVGVHPGGRRTYGRSLIVDPWGVVLAQAGDGEGFALARLRRRTLETVRQAIPSLTHRQMAGAKTAEDKGVTQ